MAHDNNLIGKKLEVLVSKFGELKQNRNEVLNILNELEELLNPEINIETGQTI